MGSLVDVCKEDAPCLLYLLINELQLIKKIYVCQCMCVCINMYVYLFIFWPLLKYQLTSFKAKLLIKSVMNSLCWSPILCKNRNLTLKTQVELTFS